MTLSKLNAFVALLLLPSQHPLPRPIRYHSIVSSRLLPAIVTFANTTHFPDNRPFITDTTLFISVHFDLSPS